MGVLPIGIVTKNRVPYLDVTLRSLSATSLPTAAPLIVFDDCSDTDTQRYYREDSCLSATTVWPTGDRWRNLSLGDIGTELMPKPVGVKGRVAVVSSRKSHGVVGASCLAACHLFDKFPAASGIMLLQDDVVFNADWYVRMQATLAEPSLFEGKHPGLLAGMKLNQKFKNPKRKVVQSGITAQCLYISRKAFNACELFFRKVHTKRNRFDDSLRNAVAAKGMWAGCMLPFVCQHIGIDSLVRPGRKWFSRSGGRIGYHSNPPYAMSDSVRKFVSE